MSHPAGLSASPSIRELEGRSFDLAVVGAGINGCAAAQELAAGGYSVLLVDKGDYGAGSSSRSTRLIHCGLRYLAPGGSPYSFLWHPGRFATAIRMTAKAMRARNDFVTRAPERTRKIRFGFPVWNDMPYRPWHIDVALRIVEAAGPDGVALERKRYRPGELDRTSLFGSLRDQDKLLSVNTFAEYQFDWPERVAMDMVLDATRMGAMCLNYTAATGLTKTDGGDWRIRLSNREESDADVMIGAKVVLNTAGIWIDRVNQLAQPDTPRKILGTKGAHIVVRLPEAFRDQGVITLNRKMEEPVYLVPWRQGLHYMGVTETVYDGDVDDIRASKADVEWLLDELNHLLPALNVTHDDILYTWAGVRPLTYDPALPKGARSREIHDHEENGTPGVFSMTAGPVTTHRSAGQELCAKVAERLSPSGAPQVPDYAPRPMGAVSSSPALLNHYDAIRLADLEHVARHEQVTSLTDVLARRTGLVWTETGAREGASQAAETVASVLGWDSKRIDREVAEYLEYLARTIHETDGCSLAL